MSTNVVEVAKKDLPATLPPHLAKRLQPRLAYGVKRPEGARVRICVIGFPISPNTGRAVRVADAIAEALPAKYETWYSFMYPPGHYQLAEFVKVNELTSEDRAKFSSRYGWSSPFCWLEYPDGTRKGIGGRDMLCAWAAVEFADTEAVKSVATASFPGLSDVNPPSLGLGFISSSPPGLSDLKTPGTHVKYKDDDPADEGGSGRSNCVVS